MNDGKHLCLARMQIFVKAPSGKVMNIAVDSNDTVKSVKYTIQVKNSLPVNRQTLLHEGRELEDGRRLQDYGIVQSSTLHLRLGTEEDIRVRVRTPSGEVVPVVVGRHGTVQILKSVLEGKLGVSVEQQKVFYSGQPLENQVSLMWYGIQDRSEVGLMVMVPITVKTLTGQTFSLEVSTHESVNEVKGKIARVAKISPEQQRLLYAGKLVSDSGSLDDYGICSGAEIYVVRRLRVYDIKVKTYKSDKRTIKLKVDASCSVKRVKKMIEGAGGAPRRLQQLTLSGVCLEDRRRMGYYNSLMSRKCRLVVKSGPSYQVFVRGLSGKTLSVWVRGEDSVEELKSLVYEREGIPPDQQRLLCRGRFCIKSVYLACESLNLYRLQHIQKNALFSFNVIVT